MAGLRPLRAIIVCGNANPDLGRVSSGDGGRKVGAAALWRERPRFYARNEIKRIRMFVSKRVCDQRLRFGKFQQPSLDHRQSDIDERRKGNPGLLQSALSCSIESNLCRPQKGSAATRTTKRTTQNEHWLSDFFPCQAWINIIWRRAAGLLILRRKGWKRRTRLNQRINQAPNMDNANAMPVGLARA